MGSAPDDQSIEGVEIEPGDRPSTALAVPSSAVLSAELAAEAASAEGYAAAGRAE